MERNDNLGNLGNTPGAGQGGATGGSTAGGTGGYGGTSGFGATGGTSDVGGTSAGFGTAGGSSGGLSGSGSTGGYGSTSGGDSAGTGALGEQARDAANTAKDRLSDAGSTVRDRAGQAKNTLADALEAGAERLRGRGGSQQLAGSTGYGEGSMTTDGGRVGELGQRVAGGLQSSADWLREADIDGLRHGVERQVRDNPGRTLMIAVGLGYLLGKAFRR
jgi:hypothetical protein